MKENKKSKQSQMYSVPGLAISKGGITVSLKFYWVRSEWGRNKNASGCETHCEASDQETLKNQFSKFSVLFCVEPNLQKVNKDREVNCHDIEGRVSKSLEPEKLAAEESFWKICVLWPDFKAEGEKAGEGRKPTVMTSKVK